MVQRQEVYMNVVGAVAATLGFSLDVRHHTCKLWQQKPAGSNVFRRSRIALRIVFISTLLSFTLSRQQRRLLVLPKNLVCRSIVQEGSTGVQVQRRGEGHTQGVEEV